MSNDFKLLNYEDLQCKLGNIDKDDIYRIICKNVKINRLIKYKEFKEKFGNSGINPYTTENISSLLDYNHNYYKRFESDSDETKVIPLVKLIKLSIILDMSLDDFLK